MVGWVCSLISNSQQNMGLIRQFALLSFCWWEEGGSGPTHREEAPSCRGGRCWVEVKVRLRGRNAGVTFVSVITNGGDRRELTRFSSRT